MSSKKVAERDVDALVVGGGPAGLYALKILQTSGPAESKIGLVESGPSFGGRSKSALHLIDSELSGPFPVLTGSLLAPPRVRWERTWVPLDQVDWEDRDWVAPLPQWKLLSGGLKTLLLDVSSPEIAEPTFMKARSPVSRLSPLENGGWEVTTPDTIYRTKRLVWAAGLKAFQNAIGKHEAQDFLITNPDYSGVAADFRGGIGLDVELPKDVRWEEGFEADGVFALPVRFESKLFLMIGVVNEEGDRLVLKTLTHAHQDLLGDPKAVATFQKALRRGIKALMRGEVSATLPEHWVVSDRVYGHRLGMPWLLKSRPGSQNSIIFVGDETDSSPDLDTLGALDSVVKSLGVAG